MRILKYIHTFYNIFFDSFSDPRFVYMQHMKYLPIKFAFN